AAGAGLVPFVAAPGGSAQAGGRALAPALRVLRRPGSGADVAESHRSLSSTFTRWRTLNTMPRIWGVSSCTTVCCIRRIPSARTVAPWSAGCPLALFVCVILSLRAIRRPLSEHLLERAPAHRRHVRRPAQPLQAVDRRLHHVVRVARAEALREHVLHPRHLEHGAHTGAGDDAGTRPRRLEHDLARAESAHDQVRNRATLRDRDLEHVLLRGLARLADRVRHFVRLAQADADPAALVAERHDRVEREPPPALDDLGAAIH